MKDLFAVIAEKQAAIERARAEIKRIEGELETLTAAARILEGEPSLHLAETPPSPTTPISAVASGGIRKAFP